MKSSSFFIELKRRNVYKVGVAYAVVSWLLIQAASILLPTFELPAWMMKVLVAVVALGFILSAALSWAFEMTPMGIKRATDISPDEPLDIVRQLEAQARQQFVRGYLCALVYAGLGDKTEAIECLKREYLNHEEIDTTGILVDPLRCDPWLETPADKSPEITQPRRPMLMSTLLTGNGLSVLQPTEDQRIEIRSMPR